MIILTKTSCRLRATEEPIYFANDSTHWIIRDNVAIQLKMDWDLNITITDTKTKDYMIAEETND